MALRKAVDVSVIIPIFNAECWIEECLEAVFHQTFQGALEVSLFDDGSTDNTQGVIDTFLKKYENHINRNSVTITRGGHKESDPRGVGYAKNRAVQNSCGKYLCFQDADDVMKPDRIQKQFECALTHQNAIIGSKFERLPATATVRFTTWANNLTHQQLYTQVYLSHGPTLIMPTWFCPREVYDNVGGFNEAGRGTPEDLIFFYRHLDHGGTLCRVDETLLLYRHHPDATTFSVSEETIWKLRLVRFQERVLLNWDSFTIWNAGKQGRKFFRSLSSKNRAKVAAFCDVDSKKITKGTYTFEESLTDPKPKVPILHFTKANSPFVICVKLGLTCGQFEDNLTSLNLKEGVDYYHFN